MRSFLAVLESRRHVDDRRGLALDIGRMLWRSAQQWLTQVVPVVARNFWDQRLSGAPGQTSVPRTSEHLTRMLRLVRRSLGQGYETLAWYWGALGEGRRHPADFMCWYVANVPFLEDVFWAFDAPLFWPAFRIAPVDTAVRFAFEACPEFCFERNHHQLPFGCHAWTLFNRQFWEPYLLR